MTRKRRTHADGSEAVESGLPECPLDEHHYRTINGVTICVGCHVPKKDLEPDDDAA